MPLSSPGEGKDEPRPILHKYSEKKKKCSPNVNNSHFGLINSNKGSQIYYKGALNKTIMNEDGS